MRPNSSEILFLNFSSWTANCTKMSIRSNEKCFINSKELLKHYKNSRRSFCFSDTHNTLFGASEEKWHHIEALEQIIFPLYNRLSNHKMPISARQSHCKNGFRFFCTFCSILADIMKVV